MACLARAPRWGGGGWGLPLLVGLFFGEPALAAPDPGKPMGLARSAGFEANQGQWPPTVRFVARDGAATLLLTDRAAIWQLPAAHGAQRAAVHMRWVGARPTMPHGEQARHAHVHYVRGARSAWRLDVPLFARVVYRDVYPGVDLVFHDARGRLEYDFVVAAGADPSAIRLTFDGGAPQLDTAGGLSVARPAAALRQAPPLIFQETPQGRREVAGRWVLHGGRGKPMQAGFQLATYDRGHSVVIDPQIEYATRVDSITDNVVDAAVDAAGNLWMVGVTPNPSFPITDDAADPERSTVDDNYVVRLNAAGDLVYATYLGGNSLNCIGGVAVDDDGNAYIAGSTISSDFPVTAGAVQNIAPGGGGDGFLAKLGPDGRLLHSTYFGGTNYEYCSGRGSPVASITVAPDNGIYAVIGLTGSSEFPAPGAVRPNTRLDGDGLIARLDRNLTPVWGRFLGSTFVDNFFTRIESDAAGNAYVIGRASRTLGLPHDFPVTPGAFQTMTEEDVPTVVAKYSPSGELVYATFVGSTSGAVSSQWGGDLAVAPDGTAYVALLTGVTTMPVTPGAYQPMLRGFSDVFIAALKPDGSGLRYGTYLGGGGAEQPNTDTTTIAIDDQGQAIIGIATFSTDFPLRDAFDSTPFENAIAKLSADGSTLVYGSYVRHGAHVIAWRNHALYVAGRNVDPTTGIGALKIDETPQPCAGDCDSDRHVRVNELVIGVRIALGELGPDDCLSFDADGDGSVSIAELIAAVGALLNGC
jgi:hypothetical protein